MNKINFFQNPQKINTLKITTYSQANLSTNTKATDFSYSNNLTPKYDLIISRNKISFTGISVLQDIKYHQQLANGINKLFPDLKCKIEDLQSIVGTKELTKVLKNASLENFSVGGPDKKNIKNGTFTINLHSHTTDSDGQFTVDELLNSIAEYANQINKPVYIGITNHDTINDLIKAVEITAKNKEKFKNVKIVLGIEFNAKHEDSKIFKKPLSLEMIGYCINPFDDRFNKFLNNIKDKNHQYATEILNKIDTNCGTKIAFEDIKNYDSSLRNCGSPSFLWKLKEYLSKNITASKQDTQYLNGLFSEHLNKYGSLNITEATPSMEEVIKIINNTSGLAGIAHPARNQIGRKINLPIKDERESKYYDVLFDFLKKFKDLGGAVLESAYQYKPKHTNHPNKVKKIEFIQKICEEFDLLHAGGLDTHSKDIFN